MSVAAALVATLVAATPAPRWAELDPAERDRQVRSLQSMPLRKRLLEVSRRFLQTPYGPSPLGEAEGRDPDPTERYDLVDCLTFVETTMAISLAGSSAAVVPVLDAIRYAGQRSYDDRNHLMEAQWVPNNVGKRFLRDVTLRYAKEDAVWTEKVITRTTWTSLSSTALALPKERQVVGRFRFPMLPLDKLLARARDIPSGTLLLIVREDRPLKVTRVTHLGFVVQKRKLTYLRHAARGIHGKVVDEDLETFLTRNARYEKWPVAGVVLLDVTEPPTLPSPDNGAVAQGG